VHVIPLIYLFSSVESTGLDCYEKQDSAEHLLRCNLRHYKTALDSIVRATLVGHGDTELIVVLGVL
jgi:hypothetical protein